MNAVQQEAVAIVHAGLADVLEWLGETPIEPWEPRHAAEWGTVGFLSMCSPVPIVVRHSQVPN